MAAQTIDRQQFERAFREYYSRLYFFALRYIDDEETCRDIVSEVFAATWRSRSHVVAVGLLSYLYVAVRNACLTHLRNADKLPTARMASDNLSEQLPATDREWVQREVRIRMMEAAIAEMPKRTQRVLQSRYFERHTYREIAEELGITTEGVKKQISRALSRLRQRLDDLMPSEDLT